MIETIYSNPNELYHYGVKGMKWGVRRYQNEDGTRTLRGKMHEKAKNRYDFEKTNSRRATYKRSKSMSTEDLKSETKRLNAEHNYRQAIEQERKDSRSATTRTLAKIGGVAVGTAVGIVGSTYGKQAGNAILQRFGKQMTIYQFMK